MRVVQEAMRGLLVALLVEMEEMVGRKGRLAVLVVFSGEIKDRVTMATQGRMEAAIALG